MKSAGFHFVFFVVLLFQVVLHQPAAAEQNQSARVLFDFEKGFDVADIEQRDLKVELIGGEGGRRLRVASGHSYDWPGFTLKPDSGCWDLSDYKRLCVDVRNVGETPVKVFCRVDNPGADGVKNCLTEQVQVEAGDEEVLSVLLKRKPADPDIKLFGMRGFPAELGSTDGIDTGNVTQLIIFVNRPEQGHQFEIDNVRAEGRYDSSKYDRMDAEDFFPLIDKFGQYIHRNWPGKIHSVDDLAEHRRRESADLTARPQPDGWDEYGGWQAGPQLEATGFFRVQKYRGKWWFVDPAGRLFFSHGIDCVRSGNSTPISDREHYFSWLPEEDSPFAEFYGRGGWAPHGYYKDHSPYRTYDFCQANLLRKYGDQWRRKSAELAHRRLRSWGMNTIANWSDSDIYLMRKTPYVATVSFSSRPIEGSEGYWGKFPDPYDDGFRSNLRERLAWHKDKGAGDPWCIGFFVHNELAWGSETSLATASLVSPADQPAKKVFVRELREKYGEIGKLNEVWGSDYDSWQQLLQSTEAPDEEKAGRDLREFYTTLAERYFEVCRDEVKRIAPDNLYFGCRFAWVNDRAIRAAAKYCDLVSFNLYRRSVADFSLPEGIDKPVIIGEFHFGALDRGMFHTGLQATADQDQRAAMYKSYVRGALANPLFVGTGWFQYRDQATTGRGDGENYQIGFVDICDTPYRETIDACRQVGYNMYEYRLAGGE